jgi:hypothetical protein
MALLLATISDEQFIKQFEDLTLDKDYFNHVGHLRISWLYLHKFELEIAISLVCNGIQYYATHLGAKQKFHLTITDSLVRIMAKRNNEKKSKSWLSFLAENNDLVEDSMAVLMQYFTKERLLSEQARMILISPDLKSI